MQAYDLRKLSDELLIDALRGGDDSAQDELFDRYKNFVRSKARSYFLIGADREDIIQEGMIGLYKAMRDFRSEKQNSFRGFAELCITRQMITAIKSATRQKHIPLNSYVSLNKPVYDEENDRMLIDMLVSADSNDPEQMLIGQEDYEQVRSEIFSSLSNFESTVLKLYLVDCSYQEIAQQLGCETKAIDNALQRVKRKIEKMQKEKQ